MKDNKEHILYAVGIGLLLSDLIPTPADALFFYLERENKENLELEKINPKQYWRRDALYYYGLNALWWGGVLGATYLIGSDFKEKRNLLIGLIGGGAVIGIIANNIKKDEKFYKKQKTIIK